MASASAVSELLWSNTKWLRNNSVVLSLQPWQLLPDISPAKIDMLHRSGIVRSHYPLNIIFTADRTVAGLGCPRSQTKPQNHVEARSWSSATPQVILLWTDQLHCVDKSYAASLDNICFPHTPDKTNMLSQAWRTSTGAPSWYAVSLNKPPGYREDTSGSCQTLLVAPVYPSLLKMMSAMLIFHSQNMCASWSSDGWVFPEFSDWPSWQQHHDPPEPPVRGLMECTAAPSGQQMMQSQISQNDPLHLESPYNTGERMTTSLHLQHTPMTLHPTQPIPTTHPNPSLPFGPSL